MAELLLAKSDGTLLLRLDLTGRKSLCIGRSPRCDVVVPTPTVSRRHALLYRHPDGWRMVDLGSRNGLHTEAGDLRAVPFDEDRWIRIGAVHFWLAGADGGLPQPAPVDAELMVRPDRVQAPLLSVVDANDRPVERAELDPAREMYLIGSAPTCDLRIRDESIAPVHLVVYREGRHWCVAPGGDVPAVPSEPATDAAHSILVDGQRTRRRRITASMIVRLGTHRAVFAGAVRPTDAPQAPSVAAVLEQWRQEQLSRTDQAGAPAISAGKRPEEGAPLESPDSAISAFLGESAADDE